jgi:3-hydroxyisobutyrate dehydrogenase
MANSAVKKLAFIGAGLMGVRMIRRLLMAGFEVRVWNRTPTKIEPLVAAGALRGTSPAEAASGCDAVLLCLSGVTAIEAALFSDQGVVHAAIAPPQLVDFSTIGPAPTLECAVRLYARTGTTWVDAPVSGGVVGAEQGKLVLFCGGSAADIAGLTAVFNALSQRHTRVGDLGAGQTMKLCNQLIVASNLVAIAESLTLARATGLDMNIVPEALAGGFADSLPLQIFGRRMAAGVTTPVLGELDLMLKDLRAVEGLAGVKQCHLPLMAAALDVYRRAGEAGILQKDLAALISMYPG